MILAINPAVPEYRAVVTLKPVEEPAMKITHYRKGPLFTGNQILAILTLWSGFLA